MKMMKDDDLKRYSRHILLSEIDYNGQQKLLSSHVLIIGAGGLGSAASIYLAASGIGKITICDYDDVDVSNLQRQILHQDYSINQNKAISARNFLNKVNPNIKIIAVKEKLNAEQVTDLVKDVDVILDCSDNFQTRYSLNKIACSQKIPLVSGAAIKFDGQICVFDFQDNTTPCYQCLFPDSSTDEELRCSDHGVLSPVVGVIGTIQAVETIKLLLNIGGSSRGKLLIYDAKNMHWSEMYFKKDPQCVICA
jgi:molybdopterin-synthase adenylyltransferase